MKSHTINASWHSTHRMPKNATMPQRIKWHQQHERNCSCRPTPDLVKKAIERRQQ